MSAKMFVGNPFRNNDRDPRLAGVTGHLLECDIFGECRVKAQGCASKAVRRELRRKFSYWAAVHYVSQIQPSKEFTGDPDFLNAVVVALEQRGFRDVRKKVQIITAVGSVLDYLYHVDGYVKYQGIIVTLDCTRNPHKEQCSADVLITGSDFCEGYPESAYLIAKRFEERIQCRNECKRKLHQTGWVQQFRRDERDSGRRQQVRV